MQVHGRRLAEEESRVERAELLHMGRIVPGRSRSHVPGPKSGFVTGTAEGQVKADGQAGRNPGCAGDPEPRPAAATALAER